ncbi:tubulin monoglutamylase TTLL4-like isoform X2 [Planococcus citri]|uniref:tubulin monoglutamylase TTLL4-like isoform X2 n=1 Tax=Planococcus citri TaxID=170843 RepID=UPI0031F81989
MVEKTCMKQIIEYYKINTRSMLGKEYESCIGVVDPKHNREKTPPPTHCNGSTEYTTNGTSKHTPESLDSSACECDLVRVSSVRLKNRQDSCDTNSPDESAGDTFPEASEETEEECQCYNKDVLENMSISNFEHHDDNYVHSGLRMSLFPNVPPYVKFSTHDVKGEQFPIHIHKLLRWKLSNITPVVVRKVVANTGYRLLKNSTYWGGTWGKHTRSAGFKTLYDYQKMNHFPGTFQIGRKDRLWKSMQKLMLKHGKSKFDLMPTTYILPQDKKRLRMAWKKNTSKEEPWIVKPPASARGTGIKVVHKWNQIPDNTPVIVQKYISNPFLINDTKFDLRLYVLVTSMNPLRIYLYDDGLVRFASVKYSTELNTLGDRYMHLTNYSINKLSSKYKQNEDASACQGHKWTLKTLWSYMERELNVNVSKLQARLIDLVIKTIISGEFTVNQLSNSNLGSRYNSYELFGIDVLFDTDLKPWLLEVNISPSLHSSSPLDLAVKAPMVYDLMNIAGFQIPTSKKFTEEQLARDMGKLPVTRLCYDSRLYSRTLSPSEKYKHHSFASRIRTEYLRKILEDLTPDDVRHLIQYEDELTQLGSFQKIFPTPNTHEYLQYFDAPRYYNMLFDAWESAHHSKREEGIELLRAKCEENFHLKVAKTNANSSKICEIHQKCLQFHVKNQNNTSNDYPLCLYKSPASLTKPKASFTAKPRYRSRYSAVVPSKTYLLRSRKH